MKECILSWHQPWLLLLWRRNLKVLNFMIKLNHLFNPLGFVLWNFSFYYLQNFQNIGIIEWLEVRRSIVISLCYSLNSGAWEGIKFSIVHEVYYEGVIEQGCWRTGEFYIIEKLHILKKYFYYLWFVVITKTMIFSTENSKKAFIDKLRTYRIRVYVQLLIKLSLRRK